MYTGERYDVIISTNQKPGLYWLRAEPMAVGVANRQAAAILEYAVDLDTADEAVTSLDGEPVTSRQECTESEK